MKPRTLKCDHIGPCTEQETYLYRMDGYNLYGDNCSYCGVNLRAFLDAAEANCEDCTQRNNQKAESTVLQ